MTEQRQDPSFRQRPTAKVNVAMLKPGEKVKLFDGRMAEVVDNPRDGVWVVLRFLESSADAGMEEQVFAEDVEEVIQGA